MTARKSPELKFFFILYPIQTINMSDAAKDPLTQLCETTFEDKYLIENCTATCETSSTDDERKVCVKKLQDEMRNPSTVDKGDE